MKKVFCSLATFIFVILCGFTVNAGHDVTAPRINSVTLDKDTVVKPGILNITLDITEEETGVTHITIGYRKPGIPETYPLTAYLTISNQFTGKYTVSVPISSTFNVGDDFYVSDIQISDAQGNESFYLNVQNENKLYLRNEDGSLNKDEFCPVNHGFSVKEEFDVNFQYYITNPNIISKIRNMGDAETGMVTYDANNHVASRQIFDAIKGTNKTIVFSNDSVQWVFKGSDITGNIKDIDLNTDSSETNGTDYDNSKNVLKIDFADNGVLPGKARIRLKSDYIFTLHNLSDTLYLYYLDQADNAVEKINTDVNYILDGTDHWCQFYVYHNSSYIICPQAARYIPAKGTMINDNKTKAQYRITKAGKKNGTAEYQKPANNNAKTITIPETVSINGITYQVTNIADNAFKNNKKLTKIVVGKNIKTIGRNAFAGCSRLKTVSKGTGITKLGSKAFYRCTQLTKVTIPARVTSIESQAFSGCRKLKTITIKSTKLNFVGKNALKGIDAKAKIKVPSAKLKKYKQLLKKRGQKSTVNIIK